MELRWTIQYSAQIRRCTNWRPKDGFWTPYLPLDAYGVLTFANMWPLLKTVINQTTEEYFEHSRDTAPGFDGIPNSGWKHAGGRASGTASLAFMRGVSLPDALRCQLAKELIGMAMLAIDQVSCCLMLNSFIS